MQAPGVVGDKRRLRSRDGVVGAGRDGVVGKGGGAGTPRGRPRRRLPIVQKTGPRGRWLNCPLRLGGRGRVGGIGHGGRCCRLPALPLLFLVLLGPVVLLLVALPVLGLLLLL